MMAVVRRNSNCSNEVEHSNETNVFCIFFRHARIIIIQDQLLSICEQRIVRFEVLGVIDNGLRRRPPGLCDSFPRIITLNHSVLTSKVVRLLPLVEDWISFSG